MKLVASDRSQCDSILVLASFLKMWTFIAILFLECLCEEIEHYMHTIPFKWTKYHACTVKDVLEMRMIHQKSETTRLRLVTSTPDTRTLTSRGRMGFDFSEVFWVQVVFNCPGAMENHRSTVI